MTEYLDHLINNKDTFIGTMAAFGMIIFFYFSYKMIDKKQ